MPTFQLAKPDESPKPEGGNVQFVPITTPGTYEVKVHSVRLMRHAEREGTWYLNMNLLTDDNFNNWSRVYFDDGKPAPRLTALLVATGIAEGSEEGQFSADGLAEKLSGRRLEITLAKNDKGYLNVTKFSKIQAPY